MDEIGAAADLVGSHETIAHEHGTATLQLGEGSELAERLGCPVVSDLRRNDIAAGGCGVPLVPTADRWLLAQPGRAVLAVNVGGVSNPTALPPRERAEAPVIGFDGGPGNMVVDELVRRMTGGRLHYDRDGALAAAGSVDPALLAELLADHILNAPPPRSFGREQSGPTCVDRLLAARSPTDEAGWRCLIATATVVVAGGGARNAELMRRPAAAFAPAPVVASDGAGSRPSIRRRSPSRFWPQHASRACPATCRK